MEGNYDDVNRLCTELCAERDWAFVNINLRPYYAEGSKTLAFEIAEQLGWELPDRCVVPIASGSLFTKIAKGFDEWRELGLLDGELPRDERRPGRGLRAGRERVRGRARDLPAGEAEHDRQVARDRQPRRRPLRARAGAPHAAARSTPSATRRSAPASRCSPRRPGVFTETAGGVTTAVLAKLAERGDIDPDERVVLVITGDGLKTLDAVKGTFETHTIAPTVEAFEAGVAADR